MKSLADIGLTFWTRKRLPISLQTEMAECGIACLSMIASYWGHQIDINTMRKKFTLSVKGVTLSRIMHIAHALHLQARPLKLELDELSNLTLPCILHWDMSHFVVLKRVSTSHVDIHDPAVGVRRLALTHVAKHFTGVALELTPTHQFEKKIQKENYPLRSLMGRIIGLKRGLLHIVMLGLALQVCILVAPFYMQWLVDEALLSADQNLIFVLACGFLLLNVIQTAISAVRSWVTIVLATNLNVQWLANAFTHLMKLPLSYFEKRHTGDIVSKFASIREVQSAVTTQFVEGLIDGVLVVSTLFMMLLYSLKLTAIAFIAVIIYALIRLLMYRPLRAATGEQIIHAAKQQTHFIESVRGVQSIRLFGRSQERQSGWMNTLVNQFNADLRIAKLGVTYQTGNSLLFGTERVIIIWLAALLVLSNEFSVGMLLAFVSYKDQFSQRTASLIDKLFELRMLRLHGERIADIVLTCPEKEHLGLEVDIETIDANIDIKEIYFRYADGEPDVIGGVSIKIPNGQFVAITGPSGCGKTTLVKILLGLFEASGGEITVGGMKIDQIGLKNYRQLIGTVMQDDTLFSGSIAENICFNDPLIDFDWMKHCAELASIHSEIAKMPMGYNTLIGDIGTGLSGGQIQRILLARALYKKPRILILDEATSHLDMGNENAVNSALYKLRQTRIVIAHRQDTINMADRVVVLQDGVIVQDSSDKKYQS